MKKLETTAHQFALFRIIFGCYLFIHFAMLIPYSGELFSNAGMLPQASLNFTHPLFPDILYFFDSPLQVKVFVTLLSALSLLILFGFQRRSASFILWYGWACLYNRNNFIGNPGLPYVGWLLLACALIPANEPWSMQKSNSSEDWKMPRILFVGAWWLMALGYTVSGLHKLTSGSWREGTALIHVFDNPLARDTFLREFMKTLPLFIHKALSYGSLALEVLFAPLCIFPQTRMLAWFGIVGMHLGILTMVNFADLTTGVLMIHLFTFDRNWFAAKPILGKEKPIIFFDGVCGLCNHFIQFVFEEDKAERFMVSPLQGEAAKTHLNQSETTDLKSVVLFQDGKKYHATDAVIRIVGQFGSFWYLAYGLLIVPKFLRESIYSFVAANRYRWFGRSDTCRMPSPQERARFLK